MSALLVWTPEWIGDKVHYLLFLIGAFNGGHMILFRLVTLNVTNDVSATASSVTKHGYYAKWSRFGKAFGIALDYLWGKPSHSCGKFGKSLRSNTLPIRHESSTSYSLTRVYYLAIRQT